MRRKLTLIVVLAMAIAGMLIPTSCAKDTPVGVASQEVKEGGNDITMPDSTDFPEMLPAGVLIEDVKKSLEARNDLSLEMLVPEVLEVLGGSYTPEDYYIDSSGLHWGHPKKMAIQSVSGACYHPYGLSIVGSLHFVYWFSYRPPSYNAYMAWIPIYAQPYGSNGILVQKRDICLICGCNPLCTLLWTWICAK